MGSQLLITGDGSHTIFLEELNESYHSRFGALNESIYIFIRSGLYALSGKKGSIRILETGFGTGLNALLSLQQVVNGNIAIEYTAVEPYPLSAEIYTRLNYPSMPYLADVKDLFTALHQAGSHSAVPITTGFVLKKMMDKLENVRLNGNYFDLVYHDAFSPEVQPELWTEDIFRKLSDAMIPGGILVTYSSKGSVKRALISAGLSVEKLPGPAGKREFLRARKV